jgi:hypothetical protein
MIMPCNSTVRWFLFAGFGLIAFHAGMVSAQDVCTGYGPQTPRDIDQVSGDNKRMFSLAPPAADMNLCNIHFHKNAEHKARDFPIYAGDGKNGGYKCAIGESLSKTELKPTKAPACHNLKPGDTVEVHWVHSSCDAKPGKGLGGCSSATCPNPNLRVETQVFTLVNDANALDFNTLDYAGVSAQGYHQAKALPLNTGKPVEFLGSTTGPDYNDQTCSALQVTWSVRPQCAKLDINSLAKWCKGNAFEEDHAHGVRKLVTDKSLLSEID